MSRFGRDYLMVGLYTDIMFPEKDIHFIAVNENYDTNDDSNNDFIPFINFINDYYAKDTGRKIKAIFQSRMKNGMRCSGSVPYGYMRLPGDKQNLYIDEEAAPVVRRIFELVSKGKSAAYQSGQSLFSERDHRTKAYSNKQGVLSSDILLPEHVPKEFENRAYLWNSVEKNEKSWNAQLARKIVLALPYGVPEEQYADMVRDYCKKNFISEGMIADFAIHNTRNGNNPHAHIMLTMRPIDDKGIWQLKSKKVYELDENGERIKLPSGEYKSHKENTYDWNNKANCEKWHSSWADVMNEYLERNGREERADLRSYKRQGIPFEPTIHEGPAIREMEARGIQTEKGNYNREVRKFNSFIQSVISQIIQLKEEIAEMLKREKEIDTALSDPSNLDIGQLMLQYADKRKLERADWHEGAKKKSNSKDFVNVAHTIAYAHNNGIRTVGDLNSRLSELERKCKKFEYDNREIIRNYETIAKYQKAIQNKEKYQSIYDDYVGIHWKGRKEKFRTEHKKELDAYNKAVRTIKAVTPLLPEFYDDEKAKIYKYAYDDVKKKLEPIKKEIEELEKIKYYISQVMPAGTGEGAAGDDYDAPIINNYDEPASFHEQIEEAKQEAKEYNESKEEEVRKKPGNDVPGGRDDD